MFLVRLFGCSLISWKGGGGVDVQWKYHVYSQCTPGPTSFNAVNGGWTELNGNLVYPLMNMKFSAILKDVGRKFQFPLVT